jgi:hypothetical protein
MKRRQSLKERRKANRERVQAWRDKLRTRGGKETTIVLDAEAAEILEDLMAALGQSYNKVIVSALADFYVKVRGEHPGDLFTKLSGEGPSAPDLSKRDDHEG